MKALECFKLLFKGKIWGRWDVKEYSLIFRSEKTFVLYTESILNQKEVRNNVYF